MPISFRKHGSRFVYAWLILSPACSSSLDPNLDNRSCSADGKCVAGYVCSLGGLCVHADMSATLAADGGASRGGLELDADASAKSSADHSASSGMGLVGSARAAASSASGSGGTGAPSIDTEAMNSAGAPSAPSAPMGAGAAGPMPLAGAMSTAGMPAPSEPPIAGQGGMSSAVKCGLGLDLCNAMCVDLMRDRLHCGGCDKHCNGDRVCVAGKCGRPTDQGAPEASNDVAALATLLALFGLELSDLAELLDVDEDDLNTTRITLRDLRRLGIDEVALGLLGLSLNALGAIGIDVTAD